MSVRAITRFAALPLSLLVVTCGGDDERPPSRGGQGGDAGEGGSGGDGASGGSGGEGGRAAGGEAGAPEGGEAGQAGSDPAPPPVCGNGIREGDEFCDGEEGLETCVSMGLGTGTSSCVDCELDSSQCSEPETCHDALDNDGDGDADCADDECSEVCADPCLMPGELADPATVFGDTTGRAALTDPLCRQGEEGVTTGSEIIYRFVPENTGVLDLELTMLTGDLNLSVRTTCSDPLTELGCSEGGAAPRDTERLQVPVTEGIPVFVVVDGTGPGVVGNFTLHAQSIVLMCGDSKRTLDEECDDGNQLPGDGCDSSCQLESDETEDNGTFETADPFTDFGELVFAQISPPEDRDVFSVEVPGPSSRLEVQTFDLGNGECASGVLDSLVEILDASSATLAADDDSGDGSCSYAIATGLQAGTYFVRVRGTNRQSFPYALGIFLTP